MATIKKNKSGTWSAKVYVGRDDKGKKIIKSITMPTQKEVKEAARKLEQAIADKTENEYTSMKFSDYADEWLNSNRKLLASTTMRGYKIQVEAHFKPYFGKKRVNQITDMMVRNYLSEKLETLSGTTVRKHFFTLSRILQDALKGKNPCIGIKPPQNDEFKPNVPTEEEFDQIYQAFKAISNEDEAIILLAGWCGLRRGEIFALKWDDINAAEGTIRIDQAMSLEEDGYDFVEKDPKSRNGFRTIAVPEYLIELFADIKRNKHKFRRCKKFGRQLPDISHFVFQQDPQSFTGKYFRTLDEQQLPRVRFHDLRHYHASLMYKNNVPDQYAASRLGHDVWVLKRVYQHLGLKEEKEIDDKIRDMFK